MKQEGLAGFKSEDSKINLICSNTTALGKLHDFLLEAKGEIVDRMIKAHKDEEKAAEEQKQKEEKLPSED